MSFSPRKRSNHKQSLSPSKTAEFRRPEGPNGARRGEAQNAVRRGEAHNGVRSGGVVERIFYFKANRFYEIVEGKKEAIAKSRLEEIVSSADMALIRKNGEMPTTIRFGEEEKETEKKEKLKTVTPEVKRPPLSPKKGKSPPRPPLPQREEKKREAREERAGVIRTFKSEPIRGYFEKLDGTDQKITPSELKDIIGERNLDIVNTRRGSYVSFRVISLGNAVEIRFEEKKGFFFPPAPKVIKPYAFYLGKVIPFLYLQLGREIRRDENTLEDKKILCEYHDWDYVHVEISPLQTFVRVPCHFEENLAKCSAFYYFGIVIIDKPGLLGARNAIFFVVDTRSKTYVAFSTNVDYPEAKYMDLAFSTPGLREYKYLRVKSLETVKNNLFDLLATGAKFSYYTVLTYLCHSVLLNPNFTFDQVGERLEEAQKPEGSSIARGKLDTALLLDYQNYISTQTTDLDSDDFI